MALAVGWLDGEDQIKAMLKEVHRARHNAGREETRLRKAEIERLKQAGDAKRAEALDERDWKRGIVFARRKRRREEIEEKKGRRRFKAAVPEGERVRKVGRCPSALFEQFEAKTRSGESGLRELYYDVISRGLHSGRTKDYKRHKKRSSSRTTRWKSGEMGRKVRYIVRPDALEQVEGNILTNMGETIEEAIACTHVLERIEKLNRDNAGVYKHIIVGLPHHVSAEARAGLLEEITKPLREMGLPFVASLHQPDAKGDQRNFHAHIIVSLRPMERLGDHEWEFEVGKRTWLDTPATIRLQRRFVAGAFNRALASADETVRWTGKSRAARGGQSPGNTKRSQEGNRAQRHEDEVEGALSAALDDVVTIDEMDRDLASLNLVFENLASVSRRFDHVVGMAVVEFSALRAAAAEQVSTLEALAVVHEGLRPHVPHVKSVTETIADGGWTQRALPDDSHETEAGRPRHEMRRSGERSAASEEVGAIKDETAKIDPFAESIRFQLEQERGSKPRQVIRLREPESFITEFALTEAAARFEIEQMGHHLDNGAFGRVRQALLSDPPALTAERTDGGDFQLFAQSRDLLEDVVTLWQSDGGDIYFRLVLDEAPLPPSDKTELWSLSRQLPDRNDRQVAAQQATLPKSAPAHSLTSPVVEDDIPFDVQEAFVSRRGKGRKGYGG